MHNFIHQIFINDDNTIPDAMPEIYHRSSAKLKQLYPNARYKLYSGDDLERIIKKGFDPSVYNAYKMLQPYACKADLARYCLLYLYGGLYVDVTIEFLRKIPGLDTASFFAFRDIQRASKRSWSVYNGIMYSRPKSPIMKRAIEIVVENCKNRYYGIDAIEVSACVVLGKAVMSSSENPDKIFTCGQFDEVPHPSKQDVNCLGFVWDDTSEILALYKFIDKDTDVQGELKAFGFDKTNNYRQMWEQRKVYNESMTT